MRIYLIGYSYSGKTTLGKQLARRLGYTFFDTDKAIELKYHTSIPTFFSHYGEKAFRIIEGQILRTTADIDNVVVSTGGGTPCNDANIKFILDNGTAIYMKMSIDEIMERITTARKKRPLLIDKSPTEQREYVTSQLANRLPYYSMAHYIIPAFNATVEDCLKVIEGIV